MNTTVIMGAAFAISLGFQFKSRRYTPWLYWLTVVLISVFGTLVTDNLTDGLSVPLLASTAVFSAALAATFALWYLCERTLSIHSIYTGRRETFYWLAILFTFSLGTAVGDLYSEQFGFGYLNTGIAVAVLIAVIYAAWSRLHLLNSVAAFWFAYILTRPLGASCGDYLSQPLQNGGLGFGATITSGIFLTAILSIVGYLMLTRCDTDQRPAGTK